MDIDSNDIQTKPNQPSTSTILPKTFVDRKIQCSLVKLKTQGKLRRQVKTLKQKVKRRDLKVTNMKDIIRELKSSGNTNESLDCVLRNYFEGKFLR